MKYATLHWCLFNILIRLFGIMAAIFGIVALITAMLQLAGAHLPTPGMSIVVNFSMAAFSLVLAVACLTMRPYRPDLDLKKPNSLVPKVGWLTGTPKRHTHE